MKIINFVVDRFCWWISGAERLDEQEADSDRTTPATTV